MKRLWNSFLIAFSMYSRIPMPHAQWTDENMKYVMCFFPWVGAAAGTLGAGWFCLAEFLGLTGPLRTVLLMLIPILVSGGIHLDGMLDTADALSSWRPREKRIEILKDSHAGAFAIITCAVYFSLLYGVTAEVGRELLPVYGCAFFVSRCLSGLSVVTFPKMKKEGTVADFAEKAETGRIRAVLAAYLAAAAAVMFWENPLCAGAGLAGAAALFAYYYWMAKKNFGGINGDLAGWFLSNCELVMPLCMVLAQYLAGAV